MGFGTELHWTRAHSEQHPLLGGYFSGNQDSRGRTVWRLSINGQSGVWRKSESRCGSDPSVGPDQFFPTDLGLGVGQNVFSALILRLGRGRNHHVVVTVFLIRQCCKYLNGGKS